MTGTVKHPKIAAFMNNLLEEYKTIKGRPKNSQKKPFWDVVVITASDLAQQAAYELQIEAKQLRKELPLDLNIFVVSDPPGIRIGNGGSTLTSLDFLHKKFGDEMYDMKTLLIHAGGWSQRMPSASVLGKVFSIIPLGDPPFQMLDLKLALYWSFVEKIQPGVFLVCADDFLVFDLMTEEQWEIPGQGFTALAHPSTMEFGKSHGVYVFDEDTEIDPMKTIQIEKCVKVLQKPSESRMKNEGALLKGNSFTFSDGIEFEGDVVYTDSCFYFGVDVMKKLLRFKKEVGNLSCEIDAYGDFLQAVGKNATDDYVTLTFNVSQQTENLLEMRRKVFQTLNGSDIHILVLNSSKFVHIGTTKELLFHFCNDIEFQNQMCLSKDLFNHWELSRKGNLTDEALNSEKTILKKEKDGNVSETSCVVHSLLDSNSNLGSICFLEFCRFEIPIILSHHCILSNCHISSQETNLNKVVIPGNLFLHTVPIICQDIGDTTQYVTVFFNIDEDLKKSVSVKDVHSLSFLGSTVGEFIDHQGFTVNDVVPLKEKKVLEDDSENDEESLNSFVDKVSLWNLKLYTAQSSMTSSFEVTLSIISEDGCQTKKPKLTQKLLSLADLLHKKDVSEMLKFRMCLFDKIKSERH